MKLAKSTDFVTYSCNTKNEYTRILGIKKKSPMAQMLKMLNK